MMHLLAQAAGTPPTSIVSQTLSWLFSPEMAMSAGMTLLVLFLLYVIFPTFRDMVRYIIKRQSTEDKKEETYIQWLKKRTDKLENEREQRFAQIEKENRTLHDRLATLEEQMRTQAIMHEETQQRLRSLEWVFLGEVCDELVRRINEQKEEIANRLAAVSGDQFANAVKDEFEKLIKDVQQAFWIRNIENTKKLNEAKQDGRESLII